MFIANLFESDGLKKIVIMSGGFHPWTPGHSALYSSIVKQFPDADVWVAATNDTKLRPFPFEVKKQLAIIAGVPEDRFVQVKSPFKPDEITAQYNPETTALIFVRSEKDASGMKLGGLKKDGSPAYLQPYNKNNLTPLSKHGFMAYLPTVQYKAGSTGITGATQIREMWPKSSTAQKAEIVKDLYPRIAGKATLIKKVIALLNSALSNVSESFLNEDLVSLPIKQLIASAQQYVNSRVGPDHPLEVFEKLWKKAEHYALTMFKGNQSAPGFHSHALSYFGQLVHQMAANPSNVTEDETLDQTTILIPGFGQMRFDQAVKEVDALTKQIQQYIAQGNISGAAEFNKKAQPFIDALKHYKAA